MNVQKRSSSRANRWLILVIVAGLLGWGAVMVWGVIRNQADLDLRKPMVIAGVFLTFILVWMLLLFFKRNK